MSWRGTRRNTTMIPLIDDSGATRTRSTTLERPARSHFSLLSRITPTLMALAFK